MTTGKRLIPAFAFLGLLSICQIHSNGKPPTRNADNDPKIAQAPESARAIKNPFAGDPSSIAAGRKLYGRYCASCHGVDAQGLRKAPNLRAPLVQQAAPGALFWFLKNGDMKQGMPSWSRLPDAQLWQLVTYLQSLVKEGANR